MLLGISSETRAATQSSHIRPFNRKSQNKVLSKLCNEYRLIAAFIAGILLCLVSFFHKTKKYVVAFRKDIERTNSPITTFRYS